jgi:membrane-associated phospholipid phosphatase
MNSERPSTRTRHEAEAEREQARQTAIISRRWPLLSGIAAVLVVAGLGAVIAYREGNLPYSIDTRWMGEIIEHRNPAWEVPALVMNNIGGGVLGVFVVPIAIIVLLCVLRRFWAAGYFAAATVLSAGIVQILKNTFDRPRPEDILVAADLGSFPSGHTANAATMAVVLGFVARRAWVWVAGVAYTVLMLLSRNYLGAHWLSDTVGGLVLGAGVAIVLWAPFAHRLHRERMSRQKHPAAA